MASRTGYRPMGSDGSDFRHRERIASHYKASSTNKSRLKYVAFMHFAMVLVMLFRLSVHIYVLFGFRPPSFLQKLRLPRPELWEYWWLVSVVCTVFGLFSLRRNKIFLLQQYIVGTLIFGLAPILYAIYDNLDDLLKYWETRESNLLIMGFPMVVLYNMFFTIVLQLHVFGLYFAVQLLRAWKPKEKKKAT